MVAQAETSDSKSTCALVDKIIQIAYVIDPALRQNQSFFGADSSYPMKHKHVGEHVTYSGDVQDNKTEELRAEIRNIVREEISKTYWSGLQARHPELVQVLQKEFPALVPDLRELQTPPSIP